MNNTTQDCWSQLQPSNVAFPFSWVGHIPFAMWLVCQLKPKTFVELGTHSGNSYLAICQSVKHHQLSTRCYAVDTWQGDEHAGQYDNSVYETLQLNHNERYGNFSTLLRMTFDDALQQFDNESIDLLHIDGLHTYEAVKHDFETWLPKMRPDGVILFHDIAVHERGFGVFKFWQELQEKYTFTLSFHHSNGLGVLFLQQPISPEILNMLDADNQDDALLKQQFQMMGNQTIFHAAFEDLLPALNDFESQRTTVVQLYDTLMHEYNVQQNNHTQQKIQHLEDNAQLTEENARLTAEVNKLEQDHHALNKLKASRSWRMTAPLRALGNRIRQTGLISHWKTIKRLLSKIRHYGLSETLERAHRVFSEEGVTGLVQRLKRIETAISTHHTSVDRYTQWINHCEQSLGATQTETLINNMSIKPLISVLMPAYNPSLKLLKEAVESVRQQSYPFWQLCISDDASPNTEIQHYLHQLAHEDTRIVLVLRAENGHISAASNSALALATGDYVALLDHDDLLAKDALLWVADAINKQPDVSIIYSDEDKINEAGKRFDPYFKSNWNLELFLSQNMISHLGVYATSLLNEIGGFRLGYEGAQDYDLALRCLLKTKPSHIAHIAKVLYHWRALPGSTAIGLDEKPYAQIAGERALNDYLAASGLGGYASCLAQGGYRIHAPLPATLPLVSLIIPTRNGEQLVKACIESILDKTTYPNYEILLIDNGSDDASALTYFAQLDLHSHIRVIRDNRAFNYSALNNAAVQQAKGDIIGLINNDIVVISPDWLEEMVSIAIRPGVGAVGAKLWYPDDTLQHGGVIIGLGGVAGHAHHRIKREDTGYFGRAVLTQQVGAVTAACLLVTKTAYLSVEGLDETNLTVAFNDVDFCLKLQKYGYRNIWTAFAELYHHESISRGYEDTPEKQARFAAEIAFMQQKWKESLTKDGCYNPNLSLVWEEQFQVKKC